MNDNPILSWQIVVSPGSEYDGCDKCNKWLGSGYLLARCMDDPEPRQWLCINCVAARVRMNAARHIMDRS